MNSPPLEDTVDQRVRCFLQKQLRAHHKTIDRMFGVLMPIQWLAAVAAAYWVSPLTWEGLNHRTHPHVWMAIGIGGVLTSLPLVLNYYFAGRLLTRHVNSVAQILFSVLLIHITGGCIETHFHVFGSLAFLACYRDWKVLVPATLIAAADHFIRGFWWPESVFGVASVSSWRWLEHAGWVIFEDVFLIIACLQGVAEMRSIAARSVALEDTDRWKKSILEASLDAVVSIDIAGQITEWNSKAEAIFGWVAAEVLGRPLDELIIPESSRPQYRQCLLNYCENEKPTLPVRMEIIALRQDKSELPIEFAITPIRQKDQLNFCIFIRDIRARMSAEQELRSAKEAAEAANHAKSRFLANMSHEIRTPLNGILGFNELLRRGADRGDENRRREFLEIMETSGRHLLTVINDVLDLSKIEAGQFQVNRTACAPHDILAEVVSILRVTAQKKGLSLDYFWEGNVPEIIESDSDRLRQILMNLVGNAIKFTERGSVTVTATMVHAQENNRASLQITIKDTGIGISPTLVDTIFEPFVQADSSVTRRFGGTGLGLSICKRLCQLLGGSIHVQSHPGLGSLFTFNVDAGQPKYPSRQGNVAGDLIRSATVAQSPQNNCLAGKQILLVEDGQINRQLIQIVLEEAGACVTLAENGEQGLAETMRRSFDAILLDMQMPVMDGYVAATEMRQAGVTYPIIALTAHAMAGDSQKCLQSGCSHFLSKPIQADRLLNTLVSTLGEPLATQERVQPPLPENRGIQPLHSTLPLGKPVFRAIVRDYVDSLDETISALESACQHEDLEQIERITHALQGSGGTAGFPELSRAAHQLAELHRKSELGAISEKLADLRHLINRAQAGRPLV